MSILQIKLLALVAVLLTAFLVGGYAGYHIDENKWEDAVAKQKQDAAQAYQQQTERLNKVYEDLEKVKSQKQVVYETVYKKIPKIIERPVYRNVCIDDDGMQQINAALTGKSANSSKLDPAMPRINASH